MSVNINFPNPWTFDIGPIDSSMAITQIPTIETKSSMSMDMETGLTIKNIPEIKFGITQIPEIKFGITEIPRIDIQFGLRPMRVHFPVNKKYAVCILGVEVLALSTCGESMVVIEDYVPHAMERCR